jgi:hypothetical protein
MFGAPWLSLRVMRLPILIVGLLVLEAGCATYSEGIRLRAAAPPIDDAFRRLAIAFTLEGYEVTETDPARHRLATAWKPFAQGDTTEGSRLSLQLDRRGTLYDLQLGVFLRKREAGVLVERAAQGTDTLLTKWHRIVRTLVEQEAREED